MSWTTTALVFIGLICGAFSHGVRMPEPELVLDFHLEDDNSALSFKAFGTTWKVELWLSDLYEDNKHHYQGYVESDPQSFASFTIIPDELFTGMIIMKNETYWLQTNEDNVIVMYRESEVVVEDETLFPPCDGSVSILPGAPEHHHEEDLFEDEEPFEDNFPTPEERKRAVSTYKMGVYVDQNWASSRVNPWASESATLSLLNDVNAIYSAARLGTMSFVMRGQVSNPYSTPNQMLSYFSRSVSSFSDTSYNSLLWLIGRNLGGLSYVGGACSRGPFSSRTSIAGLSSFSRLYTVKTIAHELGHIRGAPHDFAGQCAANQRTGCQCSVMSYCFPTAYTYGGAVNYFSQTSINAMRRAGCN